MDRSPAIGREQRAWHGSGRSLRPVEAATKGKMSPELKRKSRGSKLNLLLHVPGVQRS